MKTTLILFLAFATVLCAQTLTPIKNLRVNSVPDTPRYQFLQWEYDGPTDVTGFRVERSSNGTDYSIIGTVEIDKPKTFLDKSTVYGQHYWYRVSTIKLAYAKTSDPSDPIERDAK